MAVIISSKYEEKQVMIPHLVKESGKTLQLQGILDIPKNIREENSGAAVILLPGFMAVATDETLAKEAHKYCEAGYSVLRLNFSGLGRSQGKYADMTVSGQVAEAASALAYLKSLKWVDDDKIFVSGHSMGGVVAGLLAAQQAEQIKGCILWYPAAVLHDDAMDDRIMDQKYDLSDETQQTITHNGMKIGKTFFEDAKKLDIYGETSKYTGDVLILHGDVDQCVPLSYSEKYKEVLPHAELVVVPGAGHGFPAKDVVASCRRVVDWMGQHIG